MNRSSTTSIIEVEQVIVERKNNRKLWWLGASLKRTFFGSCSTHPVRRNDMNRYCIKCDLTACHYCMSSDCHRHHKMLKIYRHVYKNVVSFGAIEKYIDCTQIQLFKCNKRLVLTLNPLPHCGLLSNSGVCEICKRRLAEPELYNHYSISCKVTAYARESSNLVPPFLSLQAQTMKKMKKESKPEKPKQKRKGKPCRAPFFEETNMGLSVSYNY